MRLKPTVDQLCTIADMTVARMTPDFIANRIGVPFGDYRGWRQRMMAGPLQMMPLSRRSRRLPRSQGFGSKRLPD